MSVIQLVTSYSSNNWVCFEWDILTVFSWSFGILLWEVFTLGGSPYPGLPTEDLFSYLQDGRRMERPDLCPVDVYEIMLNCWEKSPFKRPLFAQIGEKFGHVMLKNSPEVCVHSMFWTQHDITFKGDLMSLYNTFLRLILWLLVRFNFQLHIMCNQ